ncbi:UNKNOWN [Stylonychia lemnae]|uniref:Wd-40 repeat protein n=1 Tax=Stylonychia lemnae TaxID=5949 RepID=A0A077ZN00_STYLE|nr:UNKNOWN [Stylonychia lemnae]|eukprot:CDW71337.1 UNKNOWN [Stylonychia lemnae]
MTLAFLFKCQLEYLKISNISQSSLQCLYHYLAQCSKLSTSDFQLDDFHKQDQLLVIFTWIIWIIAVLILNIVFMNFIIAVISESYERVMQKLVAETYKVKAIVRKKIKNDSCDNGQWQGFIKDLKYTIKTTSTKLKGEIIQNQQSQFRRIGKDIEVNSNLIGQIVGLGEEIQKLKEQFQVMSSNTKAVIQQLKADQQTYKEDAQKNNKQLKRLDSKSEIKQLQGNMISIKKLLEEVLQKKIDQ